MPPTHIGPNVLSRLPAEQIEESAMRQIENLSQMPFIFRHVAVMPDCHFGLGATVGSLIPTSLEELEAVDAPGEGVLLGDEMLEVVDDAGDLGLDIPDEVLGQLR